MGDQQQPPQFKPLFPITVRHYLHFIITKFNYICATVITACESRSAQYNKIFLKNYHELKLENTIHELITLK